MPEKFINTCGIEALSIFQFKLAMSEQDPSRRDAHILRASVILEMQSMPLQMQERVLAMADMPEFRKPIAAFIKK